jgi:hypothetical protein
MITWLLMRMGSTPAPVVTIGPAYTLHPSGIVITLSPSGTRMELYPSG